MSDALPLIAGGVLALAELASSALQPSVGPKAGTAHLIASAALAGLGGVVVSALVLLAAASHLGRSLPVTIAGTAAAVIAVALLSRAWRW